MRQHHRRRLETPSEAFPAYLSHHRPGDNMYAFLGNTLLAALPAATPPQAATCGYSAADLASTQDATISPEIQNLAKSLNYSPAKIFQHVSNTIQYEPYYGSLKGAAGVLYSQAGGPTDQASFLIALLRASNIPARYVRGTVQVLDASTAADGGRIGRWLGAKSYAGAQGILGQGRFPTYGTVTTSAGGPAIGVAMSHVWVEACVPYAHYRGAATDNAGFRWIPLDPSFKDKTYQAGIATSVNFDYSGFLAQRRDALPHEWYAAQVTSAIKSVAPNFANNTLSDVPYSGAPNPLTVDVLPATLPYEVTFTNWSNSNTPETADLPDSHRYKFTISVMNSAAVALAPALTLSLPQTALSRVTLAFQGATAADASTLSSWQNDANIASALPCTVNVVPVLRLEGALQTTGTTAVNLCSVNNQLSLSVTLGELASPTVNSITYPNIGAANYHALQAYSFQASDRLLSERATKLLAAVKANPNPNSNLDQTEGEYLHLVGLKFVRYVADASKTIGRLDGGSGESGQHLGLVSTAMKVQYVFDLPFAVDRAGLLVDFPGGQDRGKDLVSGQSVAKTFLLTGYAASNYESYMWQENAQRDAVSTVRGLQYANERGIPVLNITSANAATQLPLLTSNSNSALNYAPGTVATIQTALNNGFTFNIPRSLIQYDNWTGAVWQQEKIDSVSGTMAAGFIIGGSYAGGLSLAPSTSFSFTPNPSSPSIFSYTDFGIPSGTVSNYASFDSFINSGPAANGWNSFIAIGGDPVNVLTGNLIHTERDLSIKGRGGLPLVFERTYNSRLPADGPLGFGWTHSFNHFLKFYGVDTDGRVKLGWVDGSGGEKFFSQTPVAGGVGVNTTLNNAPGIFVTLQRIADGRYTVREKNGLSYTFESNAGTTSGQTAKLQSITDRNGNSLTLTYSGNNLTTVSDSLGRQLSFSYNANHLIQMQDWSGRIYQYGYDANGDLVSFKNPLAVAGQAPVSYSYYSAAAGPNLAHAMQRYQLPRGNGMDFEYYVNGRVFRHTTSLNETNTFTYNTYRRETLQTNERGQTRRFLFNPNGDLIQLTEENGAVRTYSYDSATQAIHNRLSKTDPEGYVTSYSYDASGNVTSVLLPSGKSQTFANFTAFHQPGKIKDANGNVTLFKYDAKGNLTQHISLKSGLGAALDPLTYTPVAADLVAWRINSFDTYGNAQSHKTVRDFASQAGPSLQSTYDAQSLNLTRLTRSGDKNGDGVIAPTENDLSPLLAYDSLGRVVSGIDRDWHATQIQYDSVDRVIRGSDALGLLRDYQFDANGNPAGEKLNLSVNGTATLADSLSASFDQSDRRQTQVDAGGNVTRYQYDAAGNLIQISNPDNYTLGFQYDAANHLIQAFDQENHAVSSSLDLSGKPRASTDPNGNRVQYVYYDSTRDGRLKQSIDAANRSTTLDYDGNGNVIQVTDNLGRITLTQYDELNRPVRIVGPQYSDATLGNLRPVTQFSYDTLGNRSQVLAGRTSDLSGLSSAADVLSVQLSVLFDDFGRPLKQTDALGKFVSYQYDLNNNVTLSTDAKNQTTSYTWLYGHQLASFKDASNITVSYLRNSLGQVTLAQSPAVTTGYSYDAAHRLQSVKDSRASKTLSYTYSPGGLLNSMSDSDANRTDYLYDPVGRLAGIWAPNDDYVSFAYDAGGRLTEKWFPNGVNARYSWNADNTLNSLTNKAGSATLSSHAYTYDGVGNRQTQAETFNGATISYSYQYDPLNRLTQVTNGVPAQQENYAYDSLSNRTSKTVNATTPVITAYVYDAANQLKEIRQTNASGPLLASLAYDFNGNLITKSEGASTLSLTYDALNRMVQAGKTGQANQTYAYDDQGRRISKSIGSSTTNFLYAGPDIVAEYASTWGTPAAQYTHGPNMDDPIIRATATAAQYFHQDGLGSIVALTGTDGPRSNVALAANGGIASASSTYSASFPPQAANNGDHKGLSWGAGGGWNDATNNVWPDWLQTDFASVKTINEIDVYTLQDNGGTLEPTLSTTFTQDGITAFDVQYWNGSAWVTLASVTGNNKVWRQFTFSPVSTSKIRVVVNGGANTTYAYSRIVEVEAYTVDNSATLRYDAWGNVIAQTGTTPRYGYTGREPDETGLVYYRARYYDPTIGRFISKDPAGMPDGVNRYAYVGNNPINFTDPEGLCPWCVGAAWGGLSGAISGSISGWMTAGPNASFGEKLRNGSIGLAVGLGVGAAAGAAFQPQAASVLAIQATSGVLGAFVANPATTAITQKLDNQKIQPFQNFTAPKLAPAVVGALAGPAAVGAARIATGLANGTLAAAGSLAGGTTANLICNVTG